MSNYSVYLVQPNLGQVSQPFYQPPLLEALSSQEAILSTLLDRRSSARRPTTTKETKPSTSTAPQEPIVRDPNLFSANELRSHLLPDYFDIVKNPMDLKTIKDGLDQGKYKNPWEFCEHMWLMFENAWLYNRKNTKVHKWCTRLSEIFIEEINPVMRQMGYCFGQKLSFTP
uniref:Histone acetyltransferase n=1 Tax=Meloidogyne hapla TaxID=6305 RepID=A0A1I8BLC0_MELHA